MVSSGLGGRHSWPIVQFSSFETESMLSLRRGIDAGSGYDGQGMATIDQVSWPPLPPPASVVAVLLR